MRKALIGILIATTAASPLAAQDHDWRSRGGERHQRTEAAQPEEAPQQRQEARQERREQRQEVRQEQYRQQGERQGGWQARQQAQAQAQAAPQPVQVQQQVQTRGYRQGWQGQTQGQAVQSYGRNWQGQSNPRAEAYRQQIEASRASNRAVSQDMPERYQRRAAENERNYEQQLRRDYRGGDRNRNDGRRYGGYGYDQGGYNQGYNQGGRDRRVDWNRSWRNDNRYDWQRYRYSHRDIFSRSYRAPYGYGYGYNRLSVGLLLDEIFWGRDYWISDPWQYRLPAAPYGTQWVRYYNDVVLVDVYTGEVVDVIYDFFW